MPTKTKALKRVQDYLRKWEKQGYPDEIPDEAPHILEELNKAPSYRAICKALLKGGDNLESLGFNRESCSIYSELKRIEIEKRSGEKNICIQEKLF